MNILKSERRMMNLVCGKFYKVKQGQLYHAGRIGRFEFMGGPNKNVVVLSDVNSRNRLFAVGKEDIAGEHNEFEKNLNGVR
jgi:hypothetical protein